MTLQCLVLLFALILSPWQCEALRGATEATGQAEKVSTAGLLSDDDEEDDDDDDDDDDDEDDEDDDDDDEGEEVKNEALELDDEEAEGTIFKKVTKKGNLKFELQTKLRFRGNKVVFKNPDEVQKLVGRIKALQKSNEGNTWVFCMHIGTSAPAEILTNRKDFMEGRANTFKKAFQPGGRGSAMVDGVQGDVVDHIFHTGTHRFAGVVMKSKGETCKKGDLVKRIAEK